MPETPEVIRGLAATMVTKFTPPSFVPGCEVKSVTDISEYATDNGWIEAIVGGDNQQRIRYYGSPQGVAAGDFVDVEYFPAYKLYRVFGSTLGGTAAVGGLRVSKIWDSDFGAVALEAGTVNVTLNGTRTLTIPTDLRHGGDITTKLSFGTGDIELFAAGVSMLKMTNAGQDLVKIGDVDGGGDVDINFNSGAMFIRGSDDNIGIGTNVPNLAAILLERTITSASANYRGLNVDVTFDGAGGGAGGMGISATHTPSASVGTVYGAIYTTLVDPPTGVTITNVNSFFSRLDTGNDAGAVTNANTAFLSGPIYGSIKPATVRGLNIRNQGGASATGVNKVYGLEIASQTGAANNYAALMRGLVGVGPTDPLAQLHVDQSSTTAAIPALAVDQADLSEELINFITTVGAGNPIDTAAIGTYYGKARVAVNGTFKYVALYNS